MICTTERQVVMNGLFSGHVLVWRVLTGHLLWLLCVQTALIELLIDVLVGLLIELLVVVLILCLHHLHVLLLQVIVLW